jgi:Tol biopolymer transport system component/DNA-binding winged helix-turn-helix (wHTH) protein
MSQKPRRLFEFGPFRLDTADRILLRGGDRVPLTPRTFDLLLVLVEHHGRVVEKDQLMKLVWADSCVEETNLSHHISILRSTLSEDNNPGRFIETLPRRGYRFVAPVREEFEGKPENREIDESRPAPGGPFQNAASLEVGELETRDEAVPRKRSADETARPTHRRWIVLSATLVFLIALATLVLLVSRLAVKSNGNLIITRLTSNPGLTTNPVISRDGKIVAYASDRRGEDHLDIWVQQVAGGPPIRLTNSQADDAQPDISPDGSTIVFKREGSGLYLISTLGGEERLLANQGQYPRFSPDGQWVAYSVGSSQGVARVYLVSSTGGPGREMKTQVPWAQAPIWLPGGKHLLFLGSMDPLGFGSYDWWVAPAEGGQAIKTGAFREFERNGLSIAFDSNRVRGQDELYSVVAYPGASSGDRIIFSARKGDSANLWQVAINPKTWHIKNPPVRLTTGSGQEFSPSIAADGRMVFATVNQHLNLWILPVDANRGRVTGKAELLSRTDANSLRPSLSSDGRKLVFVSDRSGNAEIWLRDFDTGKETPLTNTPWDETHPYITADGSKVFYESLEKPDPVIYVLSTATHVAEKLCDDCGLPLTGSPDGTRIFYHHRNAPIGRWRSIDVVNRDRMDVIRHERRNLHMLRLSFDGKWLAFHVPMRVDEGRSPIIIAPLRSALVGESEWIEVTNGTGIEATPWWSPDGGILYFLSKRDGFQCIWAQHLDKATKRPVAGPFDIAHFHGIQHRVREVGFGPGVAADKLVFTIIETSGNVWMANIQPQK